MSSPATLLSIVCYGLQDTKIFKPRGQPDLKNYVKVNKKTSRWAAQWVRIDFDGDPAFGKKNTCTIPRKAELLTQLTLVVNMPDIATPQKKARNSCLPNTFLGPTFGWTNSLGHAMINLLELDIGGVNVDRMDGRFLELYDELYESNESVRSKNRMIQRVASGFNSSSIGHDNAPTQVKVPLPFWFSRGSYCNALPIDGLSADTIQVHVTFRPVNELHFTESKIDQRNMNVSNYQSQSLNGVMPNIEGAQFLRANPESNSLIYSINPIQQLDGTKGEVIPNYKMPNKLEIGECYLLAEYISLEDAEAIAIRSSMIDYRVEQHYILQPQETQMSSNVRIRLPQSNPVKDMIWFAQRPEVANYNAWFLFTRDLISHTTQPDNWWKIPWWPDAILTASDQSLPAFRYAHSEPIKGAELSISNVVRFNHQSSPSLFRSLLPLLHYRKAPLFNRYIYVYPFSLAPGASDDQSIGDVVYPRGLSNWEKLSKKELRITMNPEMNGKQINLNIHAYITIFNVFRVFGGRGVMLFAY
jgi:hypothetical protein